MYESDVENLAQTAAHGDLAALNVLLVTVRPEVLRLCSRLLANREDAEEACQDTLLAVSRGIDRFEGRSAFRTWLHRLATNRARSTYRRARSAPAEDRTPELTDLPDPRRTSVVASTRLDLLNALARLRPELAEAVALRDVLGLGYHEIAELQRIPDGTVKSRIHEARRQLRGLLTPQVSPAPGASPARSASPAPTGPEGRRSPRRRDDAG
ncbi:sigma-70 family RNA polymerase sigma factor [Actinoplanes sp. NBRC 103695]|uniref:RNA polymerase sigma factor n=1 Tax=Actinoplanes sp. NBRC 103695 TaxID=3032202 RepID=UPI0024A01A10|nr:sigma-70 family RNA polymerase sigma factor [Actinoplanes sp. NBRC 103695]GLZ00429.1 RNA polymerase subunit sigma-24 [Actinoplanes sp. NBRC 103695]